MLWGRKKKEEITEKPIEVPEENQVPQRPSMTRQTKVVTETFDDKSDIKGLLVLNAELTQQKEELKNRIAQLEKIFDAQWETLNDTERRAIELIEQKGEISVNDLMNALEVKSKRIFYHNIKVILATGRISKGRRGSLVSSHIKSTTEE